MSDQSAEEKEVVPLSVLYTQFALVLIEESDFIDSSGSFDQSIDVLERISPEYRINRVFLYITRSVDETDLVVIARIEMAKINNQSMTLIDYFVLNRKKIRLYPIKFSHLEIEIYVA